MAIVACGCSAADDARVAVEMDTLPGGTIVARNKPASDQREGGWRLELVARIPARGADSVVFGRVYDVALGPRNEVHVVDGQASEVLVFDTTGRFVRRIGRPGQGPGEFVRPYAVAFDAGGREWIAEEGGNRYSIFGPGGEFVETKRRPMRFGFTRGVLLFSSDGDVHELNSGVRRAVAYRIAAGDSMTIRDTLALPNFDYLAFRRALGTEELLFMVPFAPRRAVALTPSGDLWMGDASRYQILRIGRAGDTLRIIEVDRAPVALSAQERARADALADSATREGYAVDRSRIPGVHPSLSAIVAAEDGSVWVQRIGESEPTGDGERTSVYDVFDRDGVLRATLAVPFAASPAPQVTASHVVGVVLGPDDEPFVELYRIVRP
jgi:hypothetical protein